MVEFAVNYSFAAADLLGQGQVQIDRFKCPAWPDLIAAVQDIYPIYVHFPLRVGSGINDAADMKTGQPADWSQVERLLTQTNTPFVNLHMVPSPRDYPDIPPHSIQSEHVEMLTEHMIQDARAVVERFGSERVILENVHARVGRLLPAAHLPEAICCVIEESDCGFLFDLSHARMAAHDLSMDIKEYISGLPTARIREIHVTGVQRVDGHWIDVAYRAGVDVATTHTIAGQLADHLPMTDQDWVLAAWAMEQVRSGAWGAPRMVTFELGGVNGLYEAVAGKDVLAAQIPRLYTLVKDRQSVVQWNEPI